MTVVHLGDNNYKGLTADTKPTNAPAGSIYRDTQLDIIYEFNGSSWDVMSSPLGLQYGEYLYKMYIDPADSKYKAFNYNTNTVEFTSAGTTDCLAVFNSVIAAAHTAKKPVFIDKGKYLFSAAPTVAGKYVHVVGVRTGGYAGGQGDYTNETVLKKNYTGAGIFIHWDSRSVYCKQQWEDVVIEGYDTGANGTGLDWADDGIGMEINSISEVWNALYNVMICHFATGLKLKATWEMGFWNVVVYNCSAVGIHTTDETSPARAKAFECKFWGGEIRGAPIDIWIEKGDAIAFEHFLAEGVFWNVGTDPLKVLYNTVNCVKIGSEGANTLLHGCSFENPCQGIEAVLDDGFGTRIDSCRFGGTTWTAQTIYRSNVGNKCKIINNSVHPYTASAVATILLSSDSTFMTVKNNDLMASAGGASLVITDSSGDTKKNTLDSNSSETTYLNNSIGPATTFRSPVTMNGKLDNLVNVASGFEPIASFGLTGTTDALLVENAINSSGHFSPILRADTRSVGFPSTAEAFHFQGIINPDNDTGTTSVLVFAALNRLIGSPFTQSAITSTTKPLIAFRNLSTDYARFYTNRFWLADAKDIEVGTTTGTKIGTATSQKIGFFNKAPVTQRSAITSPDTTGAQLKTAVDAIRQVLIDLGLTA